MLKKSLLKFNMQIQELLTLAQSKLSHLNDRKNSLIWEGNVEYIIELDEEISQTEETISKLSSIQ